MNGVIDATYRDVLAPLAAHAPARVDAWLTAARRELAGLRQAYRDTGTPDFSSAETRMAYTWAYHPIHVAVAWWALEQADFLLDPLDKADVTVVILGAGPGAEASAIAHYAATHLPCLRSLRLVLVDRERGWETTRTHTLSSLDDHLPDVEITVDERWGDLTDPATRQELLETLVDADLVLAQTVLSEIDSDLQQPLFEWLGGTLRMTTPLLLVDLHRTRGGRAMARSLERSTGLHEVFTVPATLPVGRPPEPLASRLHGTGRLTARQHARVEVRALVRDVTRTASVPDDDRLTDDQQAVADRFDAFLESRDPVAVLAGGAGTGKTTLVRHLVRQCLTTGRRPRLMAPTGQAARRLARQAGFPTTTIHSALYVHEQTTLDETGRVEVTFDRRGDAIGGDVWIVDEASLIGNLAVDDQPDQPTATRLQFADGQLLSDLATTARGLDGRQVVLVGDPDQLPPVHEHDRPAFDDAMLTHLFGRGPRRWHLAQVTRQAASSAIVPYAHAWLHNHVPELPEGQAQVQLLDGPLTTPILAAFDDGGAVLITPTNAATARWNEHIRGALGRPEPGPVPGDRVVVTRTSPHHGLTNGDEARIADIIGEPFEVRRQLGPSGPNRTVTLQRLTLQVEVDPYGTVELEMPVVLDGIAGASARDVGDVDQVLLVDAKARFEESEHAPAALDVFLAQDEVFGALRVAFSYARTAHRAQGGEWDLAIVDFGDDRQGTDPSWAYTATTRAREHLLIANLPRQNTLDRDDLEASVRGALAAAGHVNVVVDPLDQPGVAVTIDAPVENVRANVYLRHGVPSSVDVQRGEPTAAREVRSVLRTWAARCRAQLRPVPESVTAWSERMIHELTKQGLAASASQCGDSQVEVTVIDPNGHHATVRIFHRGDGTPSTIRPSEGPAKLTDPIRAALEEARRPDQ